MIRFWWRRTPNRVRPTGTHSYDQADIRAVAAHLARRHPVQSTNFAAAAIGILDALMVDRYRRDGERGAR